VTAFRRERALGRPYSYLGKKWLREGAATKFLVVQVAEPTPSVPGDSRLEVRLQNGRSLIVGRGFDGEHVRALLAVVESGI
jgi:hypothetical protein